MEDDFGDLYADVEAQASSAINGVPAMFPFLPDTNANSSPGEEPGSDSEDDLNILLNDEDCKGQTRDRANKEESCKESREQDCEDDFAAINEQTGNGCSQNAWNQSKGSASGALWNSGSTQRRHGFSLPRFRSILDVNIDAFEEKPWNDPGVDTSDYFNFGLNEDSWKQYCNTVDQFRFSAITRQENPDYVSQIQPKGRAIQVRDIFCERQPTADERRPRDQDSDVVIQINLEDASETGEKLESTDCRKEELCIGSLDENEQTVDKCSLKENASTPIAGEKQARDEDEKHYKKSFSSDVQAQLDKRESEVINAFCDDQSMVDSELSLGEEGQLSLVSSCFESDSEASRDRTNLNPGNVTCYEVRSSANSGSELWYSDASHRKIPRGNHTRVKPVDRRSHSRCKTPVPIEKKHVMRRVDNHRSDADYRHNRDRLSSNFGRWKNLAYYEELELSSGYGGGREFAKHDASTWKSYPKERQYFRREWDPYLRENRNTIRKHVDYKERFQSYRDNHYDKSRKSTNISSHFFNCKSTDADFVNERYERSNALIDQRRERLSRRNVCRDYSRLEQEDLCSSEVNDEFWGNLNIELLKHQSDRIEDGCWENTGGLFSSHQFLRETDQERHGRYSSPGEEEQRKCFGYDDSYNFEDRFIFSDDLDPSRRRRFFGRESEVLPLTEDKIVDRDRKNRRDYFSRDRESHREEMQTEQPGYKITRNKRTWQAISRPIEVCNNKNEQQFRDPRDSVDLIIGNGELSERCRKVRKLGFDRNTSDPGNASYRLSDTNLDGSARCQSVRKTGRNKSKRFEDKLPFASPDDGDLEIEEGQIIAENPPTWPAETVTQDSGAGRVQNPSMCDNERILETLAKMEKRRERFMKPIKKEQDNRLKPEVAHIRVDLPQIMQDRPPRKRRWLVG